MRALYQSSQPTCGGAVCESEAGKSLGGVEGRAEAAVAVGRRLESDRVD